MNYLSSLYVFLLAGMLGACTQPVSQQPYSEAETVFTGVNLLPMTGETVLENQSVRVVGEKIVEIGPAGEVKPGKEATIIDGSGKYLMPGLAEMHAHIPVPAEDASIVEETLFLYLSNGVTTIRGMLGDPFHLKLRQQVKNGELLSPRIYTSGPSMNGQTVPNIETAVSRVKDQQAAGYDFLKIHPGIKLDVFDAMVATAKEVGIPYAGHVPVDVGIRHALESGYASVDHLDGYVEGLVPASAGVDPNENGFFGVNFVDKVDTTLIPELAQMTREHQVWIVPTQSLMVRWTKIEDPQITLQEEGMQYMSLETRSSWGRRKSTMLKALNNDPERVQRFIAIRQQIIRGLKAAGVDFLLGSDAPQVFNVPGFSIQHEMQSMVEAGLTPYEVLVSGTLNPARYFGEEGAYGSLVEGASADLILLEANPLEDIAHVRQQAGVMVRGKWLPREYIDERLAQIAQKYADVAKK